MSSFTARLAICLKRGQMAQGDLRWWFDRPYSTTATWLRGREPRGPAGDEARRRLTILETAIKNKRGFPIPVSLSSIERPHHIKKLFEDISPRVSKRHPAR